MIISLLRTEDTIDPIGIDVLQPELSWRLTSSVRGAAQTAYQVQVAPASRGFGGGPLTWDSGQVEEERPWLSYAGSALASGQSYVWRVRVWDQAGRVTRWSEPAHWETGLLGNSNWSDARWIRPAGAASGDAAYRGHYMRKAFTIAPPIRSARLYITATGYTRHCLASPMPQACRIAAGLVRPTINGAAATDRQLDPAPTGSQRGLYSSFDVTRLIRRGQNVIGVSTVSDTDVIARLVVDTSDGRTTIVTDNTWTTHASPIVRADRFAGVTYDARAEIAGWDMAGLRDTAGWTPVVDSSATVGDLTFSSDASLPPMRIVARHKPIAITETSPGRYTLDFGQNITGRTHFRGTGTPGQVVGVIHSEKLNAKKEADPRATGFNGLQTDSYTFGSRTADWSAETAYYGFRYVTVSGLKTKPRAADIWAEEVRTDLATTGTFASSSPLLNKIHVAAVQTSLNNAHGIPEDCPHREKRGWSADGYVSAPQAFANFDMDGFYRKWLQDLRDAQAANGSIPDIAPAEIAYAKGDGDSIWGLVGTELPWDLYQKTGDVEQLRVSYPSMKRFIDWSAGKANGFILEGGKYRGDWVAFKPTHDPLLRTGLWYLGMTHLIESARLLGNNDDVARYQTLAESIRAAFNARFLDRTTGAYGAPGKQSETMSQAGQAVALVAGLVPDDVRSRVIDQFVRRITDVSKGHPESGLNGTRYVLEAIEMIGRPDLLHLMAMQTTMPSWGYMVENGPGTLWEGWGRGSLNHAWPGAIDAHFYRSYAGIVPLAAGYKSIIIRPYVPADLGWAKGSIDTPYGVVASEWHKVGAGLTLDVAVPVGTTARIVMPTGTGRVTLDGKVPGSDVRLVDRQPGSVTFEVGSGRYRFAG